MSPTLQLTLNVEYGDVVPRKSTPEEREETTKGEGGERGGRREFETVPKRKQRSKLELNKTRTELASTIRMYTQATTSHPVLTLENVKLHSPR